ncbi:glycosyltransferase family 2 protein [Hyphococcus sp.]|uniref:glycosyltransferase family 2 protein n=1 Tax=Hyphococcus sp. TaxID=2038636 RepID=UPI0035C717DC
MARSPLNVIILNYGTPDLAIASAESVLPEIEAIGGRLILVDNASPDDSAEKLRAWVAARRQAPVELVLSPVNGGFAAGNNLGIKAGEADFYLLLNSDTLVEPGALSALLTAMKDRPKLGLAGPMILDENGAPAVSRFRKRTPFSEFVDATGLDFFYRRFREHVVPIFEDEADAPDWISFACVMIRKEVIDEVGLLDENYFMYFEDSAYGLKAAAKGWRGARIDEARVKHFEAKSSGVEDATAAYQRLPRYFYAARARYFIDHYGRGGLIAANLFWLLGRGVNYARLLTLKAPKKTAEGRAFDIWASPDFTPPNMVKKP